MKLADIFKNPLLAIKAPEEIGEHEYIEVKNMASVPICAKDNWRSTATSKWRENWEQWFVRYHARHCWHREYQIGTVPDTFQSNHDIPHVQAFVDMGLTHPNEQLPATIRDENGTRRTMNDAHFRECCVVRGNQLHAFHEKSGVDFQKPWHLRPETFQRWLDCDIETADSLSGAFEALGANAHTVVRAIFGYLTSDSLEWRPGVKAAEDPEFYAEFFENLATDANDDGYSLEYYRQKAYKEIKDEYGTMLTATQLHIATEQRARTYWKDHLEAREQMENWLSLDENTNADRWYRREMVGYDGDEFGEYFAEDDLSPADTNGYSTHPLFDGSEGLRHEFLSFINQATYDELQKLKSFMYPQKGRRARFHFFTESQRSQFWQYVNDRETKIIKKAKRICSPVVRDTYLRIMEARGKKGVLKKMRAMMLSHVNGQTFTDYYTGERFDFTAPTEPEAALLKWAYKQASRAA